MNSWASARKLNGLTDCLGIDNPGHSEWHIGRVLAKIGVEVERSQ